MNIAYRPALQEDLDVLLDFQDRKTVFPCYVGFEEPAAIRRVIKQSYMAHRELLDQREVCPVYLAVNLDTGEPVGYLVLVAGIEETITREQQVMVYDYYCGHGDIAGRVFDGFMDLARKTARDKGIRYIIAEVPNKNLELEAHFTRQGFMVEMNRIVREVEHHDFDNLWQKELQVREGNESDRMFLMLLNAQNSGFLIPSNRRASREKIQQVYLSFYSAMEIEENSMMKVLVAQDKKTFRSVGYIIIKMSVVDAVSKKPLAYIYDLNVHRDYWGKYVAQRLVREAENHMLTTRARILLGDVSHSNPRALKTAIKSLNFTLYSRRWVAEVE